jgi:GNAT superfamily N-acetyltransferase
MKAEMLAPPFARVRIAPAGPHEVDRVRSMPEEAARWLLDRGIRQWPAEIGRDRLAEDVSRDHRGLGRHLLAWAETAAAQAGLTWLRLDCMAENPALRTYYERAGFKHVRDVVGRGWAASLYEKRVSADRCRPASPRAAASGSLR